MCRLVEVTIWNETAWAVVEAIQKVEPETPSTGIGLSEYDYTIGIDGLGDNDFSNNCYDELAFEELENRVIIP